MEKLISNRRNIAVFFSYLFLAAIFFIFGMITGFYNTDKKTAEEASSIVNPLPESTVLSETKAQVSNYRVILEDGNLRLYIDEDGISRLISQEAISEDSYPVSDIASLKKGMIFETADGAISLMENFIS